MKAQTIVNSLTNNSNFPALNPPVTAITTAMDELRTEEDSVQLNRQQGKERTSIRNQKEDALVRLLTQVAAHVESVAGDDEQLILSAGMDVRATAVPSSDPPPAPDALTATAGDREGEIDLSWDTVPGAKSYVIERSVDPVTAASWAHGGVSTRSTHTATGLTSGARYWFRVAAMNGNGQSGWSDPAMKIAP